MRNKILIILPCLPYPLKSGGHQAMFNGISAIKDEYDISIAYEALDDESYRVAVRDFAKEIPSVKLFPLLRVLPPKCSRLRLFLGKIKVIIKKVLNFNDITPTDTKDDDELMSTRWKNSVFPLGKNWIDHISSLCSAYHFDIIQVEMPGLISQVLSLPHGSKKLFVHHEIGFVRRKLEMSMKEHDEYMKACCSFADFNEVFMLNMYDMVVTLSPIDAKKLKDHGVHTPICSSFAIVDSEVDSVNEPSDGRRLVFIGPDSHAPNLIGITWFLENCWEKLKCIDSKFRLDIIGQWEEKRICEFKSKYEDVEFMGFVEDLKAALKGSVIIVPITIGSGIRMKILEACSNGIPFVSTTVGAEGIPVENGKHCFIANTPSEFIDDIVKLQDKEIQKKFVDNSHRLINEFYSLEALRKNRLTIYDQLLEK